MKLARFPISTLLDSASGHLEAHLQKKRAQETATQSASPSQYAGIIFSGNPHETVPRKLLLDNRLTPLERNCWQVFRLLVNEDGVTAFPTYDQLRPYLGMNPGTGSLARNCSPRSSRHSLPALEHLLHALSPHQPRQGCRLPKRL